MKLVPENINEAVKHLSGRSEEEIEKNFEKDIREIITIDYNNPEKAHELIKRMVEYLIYEHNFEWEDYGDNMNEFKDAVLSSFIYNLDSETIKSATIQTINDFIYG